MAATRALAGATHPAAGRGYFTKSARTPRSVRANFGKLSEARRDPPSVHLHKLRSRADHEPPTTSLDHVCAGAVVEPLDGAPAPAGAFFVPPAVPRPLSLVAPLSLALSDLPPSDLAAASVDAPVLLPSAPAPTFSPGRESVR